MMRIKVLFTIFFLTMFCCCQTKEELLVYETKEEGELLVLELNEEKETYDLYWLFSFEEKEFNVFGVVEFSGSLSKINSENIIFLVGNIVSNNLKFSDGRLVRAPISQSPDVKLNIENNSITFYNQILNPKKKYSSDKCLELIESFENWDGSKINFDSLLKD